MREKTSLVELAEIWHNALLMGPEGLQVSFPIHCGNRGFETLNIYLDHSLVGKIAGTNTSYVFESGVCMSYNRFQFLLYLTETQFASHIVYYLGPHLPPETVVQDLSCGARFPTVLVSFWDGCVRGSSQCLPTKKP